jgi:D-alanyl-D-alanine carboxypeptidase (penicillin-binding protein 5/6)
MIKYIPVPIPPKRFCLAINAAQPRMENFLYAQISQPLQAQTLPSADFSMEDGKNSKPRLDLDAKAVFSLKESADGKDDVIFEKNIEDRLPIASLTKLMVGAVVLNHPKIYNLDRQVEIDQISAGQSDVPTFGNLKAGEIYTIRQLLNLMLFYSSNDAAYALSGIITSDLFVSEMNIKAQEIGLKNTNFYNPHGLDCTDGSANYSNAKDLMALAKYILKFYPEIFSFSAQPGPYLTENGVLNLNFPAGQKLVGGKTGYTEKAGGCMITVFEDKDQSRYINILLGSASPEIRLAEMQKIIDFTNNQ